MGWIVGVGYDALARGRLLVATDDPLATGLSGALAEDDGVAVVTVQVGLDRCHFKGRIAQDAVVTVGGPVSLGMHRDRMVVGVQVPDMAGYHLSVGIGGVVFFSQVPHDGQVVAEPGVLDRLNVVVNYADEAGNIQAGYPHNPNGSVRNIAGICDDSGRIFALMPHPERFIRWTQHPRWTREIPRNYGDGLQIFLNAVAWVKGL